MDVLLGFAFAVLIVIGIVWVLGVMALLSVA